MTGRDPSGCPYCSTPLREESRPYAYHGAYLGRFPMLVCSVCTRVFHPSETSQQIEDAARAKGLFQTPADGHGHRIEIHRRAEAVVAGAAGPGEYSPTLIPARQQAPVAI
jgi:hypothetical protein